MIPYVKSLLLDRKMRGVDIDTFDALITKHTQFPRMGMGRHSAISEATGISEQTIKGWYTRGAVPEFQINKIEKACSIPFNKTVESNFAFTTTDAPTIFDAEIEFVNENKGLITAKINISLPAELMVELIQCVRSLESKNKNS
jgi:hypothetical protein